MHKYRLKMYKRLWITVNQTNRWAGSVFRGSVWNPANFKKVAASSQQNLDKSRLCQNVGKERKVKYTCGKCPFKTVVLAVRRWRNGWKMKVSQITLRWPGLKVKNESKNLVIVHRRVRDDVEKKMRIKRNNKWTTTATTKWRSTSQKPPEVLSSKYHR